MRKGFTLIELLIVMAILGVLAVVVLVAINPVQQLARTRDAGRKSGVAQLGRSLEAYYTSRGGTYIAQDGGNSWATDLMASGEISIVPSEINNSLTALCLDGSVESGWCYDASPDANGTAAVVYTRLESDSEISKCTSGSSAYFVWSTADGRGGLVCGDVEPTAPSVSWNAVQ